MKIRVSAMLLVLVVTFGFYTPAFAAEDVFEADIPTVQEEESSTNAVEMDEPETIAGASDDIVVLGDESGFIGYSHIGIGYIHMFAIGLATDYVLTTNQAAQVSEIKYSCDQQTGVVTGQVDIDFTGAGPLVVTVKKAPGSYPAPLKIDYDPIGLLKDADTAPKYAMPGDLLLIAVKNGYEIIPDSRNFTILEDSKGDAGRVLQIRVSNSATEVNIKSDTVDIPDTPTPTPTPTPSPDLPAAPTSGTGWKEYNGNWYYFRDGQLKKNYWVTDSSKHALWYHVGADGTMDTGFQYITDKTWGSGWFMLEDSNANGMQGAMLTGWQETGDARIGWFTTDGMHKGECTWTVAWGDYNPATGVWSDGQTHR